MHKSRGIVAVIAAGLAAVVMATTGPVQGAVLESGTEPIEFSNTVNKFCDERGLRVRIDGEGTLTYRLDVRGSGGYVFYSERIVLDVTWTNVRTGAYVTGHENTSFRDVTIKDNGDGTHTITYFGTGNFTVYDSSGTAIVRNPGQLRFEVVIDLNDTPEDFDDDEVISEELILGSTGRNDDFCEAVVPALT